MLVEIRPLPIKKWHGKKDGESFTQPKIFEVLQDRETGNYATGLTEEDRLRLEKKTSLNLSDKFDYEIPHPYWSTKPSWVNLPNHTIFLDTAKPLEEIKIKNLKASNKVANSMREYEEGKYPDATHVIFDETEELEIKASKIAMKDEAVVLKSNLSAGQKSSLVMILSNKSVRGRGDDFINVEIDDLIQNKTVELLRYMKMPKEEVAIRAQVLELLSKNILTKEGGSIFYMAEMIGVDYDSTVYWFKDPNNQRMKVAILEQLEKKG